MTPHDPSTSDAGEGFDLDAYLDGTLSGSARAAFEQRMAVDGALRAEVELQRRIDARLHALAGAPEFPGLGEATPEIAGRIEPGSFEPVRTERAPSGGRRVMPAWARAAAAVMIVALGAWLATARPWRSVFSPPPSMVAADAVYNRLVRTGFEPVTVCDTDAKFLDYTAKELGAAFLVRAEPCVQLVGWTYADGLMGEHAKVLLARRGETPVIVVMDRAANDRAVRVEPGSPLRVHRATLGDIVFYEIAPDDQPSIVHRITPGP